MSTLLELKGVQIADEISLRAALVGDVRLLWYWANDPASRANSITREPIPWAVHESWYTKQLTSLDSRLWIMEREGVPVAQIRYDRIGPDTAQISFSVATFARRSGLGTLLLEITPPMAARELGVKWVRGIAVIENQASQRAFTKASFTPIERQRIDNREYVVFEREAVPNE